MKEIPMLFNTDMVRAILEGRKTQTRRIIKDIPESTHRTEFDGKMLEAFYGFHTGSAFADGSKYIKPPCQVGDVIWVRETWWKGDLLDDSDNVVERGVVLYKADIPNIPGWPDWEYKWSPSIHMPRSAARLFLKVKDVRVEKLQDITEEGTKAEGIVSYWTEPHRDVAPFIGRAKEIGEDLCLTRLEAFSQLWDSIYKNWNDNPYVWVIEFERMNNYGQ
ncbi:MAG: morphogenetic protein [Bacillota bacterium]|nr:morphogenetic protein [Bacillota bacterium]